MKPRKRIVLRQRESEPGYTYLELYAHPHTLEPGVVANRVFVHHVIENYNGPALILDFNKDGEAIGLEILYPSDDEDDD